MPSASFQVKTNIKKSTKTIIDASALTKESINGAKVKRAEQNKTNEKEILLKRQEELQRQIDENSRILKELENTRSRLQMELENIQGQKSITNRSSTHSSVADKEIRKWKDLKDNAEAEYNKLLSDLTKKGLFVRKSRDSVHAIPQPKAP
ncbi:hypothetical protein TVAG_262460 [Trichomonas vaginalis G3]|uniref:Uncharacterized protein n=1 Tax=Trichomonas vaginalis (strain ATCC PRA-98 / G3) TaxID=412133 RepID=A2DUF8_TRIV3|nr:hypothetical protein TVAGG3_0595320 [Trichomonas vaginalis G3]EAY15996.1 hypothetical protein TVAG_262460 [Trichomonas vaginalis G3]KAI5523563.1 hypothetical protein TVAGG3_0595320 [Trichomonas vaginalis G3]|eukprot:XP_001328219.1 hypothetical protein [Trichomonas vaginalis G3]